MFSSDRSIKESVVTAVGREGEKLAVVLYSDGSFGILRNGEAIPHARFPRTDLDACVATFLRLSGLNGHSHAD